MFYSGHCHCRAVGFEIEAAEKLVCQECNCSICQMSGYIHLIVPKSAFRLVQGQDSLRTYTFNTGVAQHYFCRTCGIKAFYIPRSNPDGYDINVRCLDPMPENITIDQFDGKNWEEHAHKLRHLSKES
ncbi:MAG: GFA family protein [Gammaproteobacteria bacterium]|nr:aldehyde-activating protein [Chromatiales bacterium]MDP6675687.1 GFA family protein [Gammaproteobacteria bacterium]